jgi:7-carboxy-7-deazaguanine synthase
MNCDSPINLSDNRFHFLERLNMNTQPVSKTQLNETGQLDIVKIFSTIQGEGPFAGVPAIFIRLWGCNLQCPHCDTDYTSYSSSLTPRDILEEVENQVSSVNLVILTGGEPFRQNITPLVKLLIEAGYQVQIETNGTLFLPDLPYDNIVVVCSPKTGTINKNLAPHITALKYVLHADQVCEDGLPASALGHPAHPHVARPPDDYLGLIYVQPMDELDEAKNQRHLQATLDSVMRFGFTLCLQLHKIINFD